MIKLKDILTELHNVSLDDIYNEHKRDNRIVYRSVDEKTAIAYCNGQFLPSSDREQIPFDPAVIEYAAVEDVGEEEFYEWGQDEIDNYLSDMIPWYDGSLESVSGGINATIDMDTAADYAGQRGFIMILRLKAQYDNGRDAALLGYTYVYLKSKDSIDSVVGIYDPNKEELYTPNEFLSK